MKDLHFRLLKMDGKPYGVYKSLQGKDWLFGDFTLRFTHVQGDPHASPSRVSLSARMESLGFAADLYATEEKRTALADFLLRGFSTSSASVSIVKPHAQIMKRNSLYIEGDTVYILASVSLPGEFRRINANAASEILIGTLSDYVTNAMYWGNINRERCIAHIECFETRNFLLAQLAEKALCAFVPDGAILPRESGLSELPMQNAIPFCSPQELRVELNLPKEKGTIAGMGIPRGITVVAGGGFHGKSTLLRALEDCVYAHCPGDGRELIVIDEQAVPVRTEEGRVVNGTNISPLVRELPLKGSAANFCTKNASGATSQAANLLECIEMGASTLLIDEDASAVNFLIRDERMRALINSEREPLIPLTDRIREFSDKGISFIIVAGACGDYLSLADNVIAFMEYRAECLTQKAKNIEQLKPKDVKTLPPLGNWKNSRTPDLNALQQRLKPNSAVERDTKIRANAGQISIGELKADLRKLPNFCNAELHRGIALILMLLIKQKSNKPLKQALEELCKNLPDYYNDFDVALPRALEAGAAFLRLDL